MTEYVLKKDTPFYRKGAKFSEDSLHTGVILNDDCLPVANLNKLDNPDEWFDRVEDEQWINDATIDVSTNKVQVEFADDMEAIDFQNFIRAVKVVSNDAGFMTRGSDRVGWAVCVKVDGQLDTTVTSNELAGGFCFEWGDDAMASIKKHPDEWKTIAKYKWGK